VTTEALDRELTQALRAGGQRVTLPRLLVHRHVRASDRHVTAEQLHDELARELPSLSLATVYSTLEVFEDLGLVRRVGTLGGATLYDSRTTEHHHAICRRCGAVTDVDGAGGHHVDFRAPAGFTVEHAEVQLVGLCADCASAQ
jgi:Fe2+ or Zn2+ uptake regulation protein